MRKVEEKLSIKDCNGFQQLDWRKKDTILEWAARYEIENNERLYHSILQLRKYGGTLSIKTFWEHVRLRTVAYNQIIDNEIKQRVWKIVSMILLCLLILNLLFLTYVYKM